MGEQYERGQCTLPRSFAKGRTRVKAGESQEKFQGKEGHLSERGAALLPV